MKNKLTIYIDLGALNSFLAMQPTVTLIENLKVEVEWLPLSPQLKRVSNKEPDLGSNDPLAEYKARRLKARNQNERREMQRNAQTLGISCAQAALSFDATNVHIGLLYLNARQINPMDYIFAVYDAVFKRDQNLQAADVVQTLLVTLGVDGNGYDDFLEQGELALEQLQLSALDSGIFDAPTYLLDGQPYQGRAHLPLLKWYLSGATGLAPV